MIETCNAKEYIFNPTFGDKIYLSKDLKTLMDKNDGCLIGIYAVLEMPDGLNVFTMDFAYDGDPIIMQRFMHKDSYLKFNNTKEIVKL